MDGILRFNCAIPEQKCILSQPNVGVDDNDETTSSNAQVGARKEFTGLPIGRQQRETASTEQSKQFNFGGLRRSFYFPSKTDFTVLFFVRMSRISLLYFLKKNRNAPRPSEHPPVRGEKTSKRLGGIKGCKYKTSSWHLNGFPYGGTIGSTV